MGFALRGTNVRCEFALSDDLWPVEVDEGQMVQVINNLVINALKFSPPGSTITIFAARQGDRVVTRVADQGRGIPAEELPQLFKPFRTTSARAYRGERGTGLGLTIAHEIIRGHGGTIRVQSSVGRGTTFEIVLPITPVPGSQPPETGKRTGKA